LANEYISQPQSLLDDIINSINILAERALNSVEQGLLNAPPATLGFRASKKQPSSNSNGTNTEPELKTVEALHQLEIDNGTHQLETLLCASIDKNFDLFELYVMRNILCVRPEDRDWIRLAHYDGLDFSSANANANNADAPSAQSVTALRRKLQASQRLNGMLHAEKVRNDALLARLRSVVGGKGPGAAKNEKSDVKLEEAAEDEPSPFAFLHNKGVLAEGGAQAPISTTTAFTLSQLQALRALSTSLRNIMPDLGDSASGQDLNPGESTAEGRKGWRRERLQYVEASTRKHLENIRGLEFDKTGSVRDGEWQGEGRQLARGEVEGLEKVVTILGGSTDASSTRKDEMDES
jgi:kinetochore protein Mis12/MTW1